MAIVSTSIEGFRNLQAQRLEFSAGLNLLLGANGSGKTNTLEAIYLSTSLRSFRRARLRELVAHGVERARVDSLFVAGERVVELRVEVSGQGTRRAWMGGRRPRRMEDFLTVCPALSFTPEDLAMVKGGPETRRNFLDNLQVLLEPAHLERVRTFRKLLRSRNALLRDPAGPDRQLLASFQPQLVDCGAELSRARQLLLGKLQQAAAPVYRSLAGSDKELELRFLAGWPGSNEDLAASLEVALRRSWERDRALGRTSLGPQHDDLQIELGGHPARAFASQGEQRSCALALLLAAVKLVAGDRGRPPTLLLDDVAGELDADRRRQLFERLLPESGQVFVTTTEIGRLEIDRSRKDLAVFEVTAGRLERSGDY